MTLAPLFALVAPFCALVAISDIFKRRVPNALLLAALLLSAFLFCAQWILGKSNAPWLSFIGLLVGLIAMLPFYAMHWMGAGDVKLFAVFGFLLGAKALLPVWVIASLLAGVHAIYLLASNYRLRHATQTWLDADIAQAIAKENLSRGTPYAAFLSFGALITLLNPSLAHW